MGQTYLLDTNIIIYILNGTLQANQSADLIAASANPIRISVISKMELLGWNAPNQQEAIALKNFVENSIIEALSDDIVDKTIEIKKSKRIKLPDAIIAATALINNHILITRNESDFSSISGLTVVNPVTTI